AGQLRLRIPLRTLGRSRLRRARSRAHRLPQAEEEPRRRGVARRERLVDPPSTRATTKKRRLTMSSILQRLTIDAAPERVHKLVATKEGIELWWTGQAIDGDDSVGGQIVVSFGDRTAATFEIVGRTPERIVWRCVGGPPDWIETHITFTFEARADGGT